VKGLPHRFEFNRARFSRRNQRPFAALSIQIRKSRIAAVIDRNKYHRRALRAHSRAPARSGERAKLFEIARAYLGLARHVAERRATAHRRSEHDPRPLDLA